MMDNRAKKPTRSHQLQNRLLKDSLKLFLGQGLAYIPPYPVNKTQRALFLKDALNSKILDSE